MQSFTRIIQLYKIGMISTRVACSKVGSQKTYKGLLAPKK
jgi:hypothetical protein